MKRYNSSFSAYAGLSLMTFIVGFSFIFVKIGLRSCNIYDFLAHRFTVAFVVVVILYIAGYFKITKKTPRQWLTIVAVSGLYPVLFFLFQTLGMQYSSVANAGIIMALLPIVTVIGGTLFLKETTTLYQKTGIAISAVSLVFIFVMGEEGGVTFSLRGSLFLIASVVVMAAYYLKGKVLMRQFNYLELTSIMITVGFLFFNFVSLIRHGLSGTYNGFLQPFVDVEFLLSVLYLGILSSVLTSFLSNFALAHISTFQVSVFNNVSPLITIFAGVIVMNDSLTAIQLAGSFAVLAGVVLVLYSKKSP